ncbi:sigma factor-like helix-turn-helix DNA-binding protein [Streptomyces sp. NPDC057116]|uniref:sigma factor-like helix-turn-helix DNA-binding protein n=1 Tax=Streptomyces sp. NPDC057116 TaxID=3346023 RepID=UPI003627876F
MTRTTTTTRSAPPLPSPKERRRLREAMSMTEEQLAQLVGVTRATVRSWETGRTAPRGRKRELYARLLGAAGPESPPHEPSPEPGRGPRPAARAGQPAPAAGSGPPPRDTGTDTGTGTGRGTPTESGSGTGNGAPAGTGTPAETGNAAPDGTVAAPADAFDALYAYAAPGLVQQAYLLTGRRRLSREAVEYAFHLAWERWPEVAVDRDPAGWVRAATHEYALSPWHRLRRSYRHPDAPATDRAAQALRGALLELPPAYRRTLLLYDGLGLDLPETAAETEASTPAAGNRVLHAREVLAERVPELADPAVLHERLASLLAKGPAMVLAPARTVRSGSERRARFWTRAALGLTAVIVGATAFTLATAPTSYRPPLAPGEAVGGVPVLSGPQRLTAQDQALRDRLRSEPVTGPARLVPDAH